MFLTKVFKHFNVDLNDERKRTLKAINNEYNEKTLKHMGYELKNNKWTPKPVKKKEETSSSKEKGSMWSGNARKTSISEVDEFEMSMLGFMA